MAPSFQASYIDPAYRPGVPDSRHGKPEKMGMDGRRWYGCRRPVDCALVADMESGADEQQFPLLAKDIE